MFVFRVCAMRWRCFSLVYRWQMWFSYLIMWLILIPFVLFTSETRLIYRIKKRDVECLAWMELIKTPSDSMNDLALFLSIMYMYAPIRWDVWARICKRRIRIKCETLVMRFGSSFGWNHFCLIGICERKSFSLILLCSSLSFVMVLRYLIFLILIFHRCLVTFLNLIDASYTVQATRIITSELKVYQFICLSL